MNNIENSNKKKFEAGQFLRDIIFGANDAILTNLGIIAGFTVALKDNHYIVLACLVDIFISAFAMSFGTFMSRTSEQDFLKTKLNEQTLNDASDAMGHPFTASVIMWITYILSGIIPLLPFFFGLQATTALVIAMIVGIGTFFILGLVKGAITKTHILHSGLQFLFFGVISAVIGLVVGRLANNL
jgi:predicted membrane protein (TIGR00267 family)